MCGVGNGVQRLQTLPSNPWTQSEWKQQDPGSENRISPFPEGDKFKQRGERYEDGWMDRILGVKMTWTGGF